MRDIYLKQAPGGNYKMVATNGKGFGSTSTIITYTTHDLILYSTEFVANVMPVSSPSEVANLWAPEWAPINNTHSFVFWAARGDDILYPQQPCNNTDMYRFAFYGSITENFRTFTRPEIIFDPGCNMSMPVGDGGIDGDIIKDETGAWVMLYKDARGANETVRGIRMARSSTSSSMGPYYDYTISPLLVPTLVEAPEGVYFRGQWFLYYDCSFMPIPDGWDRPPYGVSISSSLDKPSFTQVPGACGVGKDWHTSFPKGATHGSFLCINSTMMDALQKAFPT